MKGKKEKEESRGRVKERKRKGMRKWTVRCVSQSFSWHFATSLFREKGKEEKEWITWGFSLFFSFLFFFFFPFLLFLFFSFLCFFLCDPSSSCPSPPENLNKKSRMEVSQKDFVELFETVSNAIQRSDFVSIDLELTVFTFLPTLLFPVPFLIKFVI